MLPHIHDDCVRVRDMTGNLIDQFTTLVCEASGGGDDGWPDEDAGGGEPGEGGDPGDMGCAAIVPEPGSNCPPAGGGGSGDNGPPSAAPEGVNQDLYDRLNEKEKALCWSKPTQCFNVWGFSEWALDWAAQTGLSGAHNGPQDAVRHAAWSARIAWAFGTEDAKAWTDAHEWNSSHPDETAMDQYNNAAGREIGRRISSLRQLKESVIGHV